METMERKTRRHRRSFTPEFKADIVERCRAGDRSIGQVARNRSSPWPIFRPAVGQTLEPGADREPEGSVYCHMHLDLLGEACPPWRSLSSAY
jgi:hypothetical protein